MAAFSSTNNLNGGESFIRGSACFSQQLKALDAYLLRIYCFNFGKFSGVGAQGSTGRSDGGADLIGQEHGVSALLTTPELEHLAGADMSANVGTSGAFWVLPGVHDPMVGKSGGMVPRSMHPALDMCMYSTELEMYTSCLVYKDLPVSLFLAEKVRRMAP